MYSNCDEVQLTVNGKQLGRKKMERNGYLSWDTVYQPGKVRAVGYRNGKKVLEETVETTEQASRIVLEADRTAIDADNRDVSVCTVRLVDRKGRFVPDACERLTLTVAGPVRILGVGNGDPAWQDDERPDTPDTRTFQVHSFNGLAQVLLQSTHEAGEAALTVQADGMPASTLILRTR